MWDTMWANFFLFLTLALARLAFNGFLTSVTAALCQYLSRAPQSTAQMQAGPIVRLVGVLCTGILLTGVGLVCWRSWVRSDYIQDPNIPAHRNWTNPSGYSVAQFWHLVLAILLTPLGLACLAQTNRSLLQIEELQTPHRLLLSASLSVGGTGSTILVLCYWANWHHSWDFYKWKVIPDPSCSTSELNNCGNQNGFAMSTSVSLLLASAILTACSWSCTLQLVQRYRQNDRSIQECMDHGLVPKHQTRPDKAVWQSIIRQSHKDAAAQMWTVIFLVVFLPGCWLVTTLLPNHAKLMSTSEIFLGSNPQSVGKQSFPGAFNSLVGHSNCVLNTTNDEYGTNTGCYDGVGVAVNVNVWSGKLITNLAGGCRHSPGHLT